MFWLGIVLLGFGVVLLGLTSPSHFFESARGSFFDWTELFWYLQWFGFWLLTASLLIFGALAWRAPATFAVRWKVLPPAIGLLIFAAFFIWSMPEKSNQRDWRDGWLGARVYWRTKLWMRGDDTGEDGLPDRLAGRWETPGGVRITIARDRIEMTSPAGKSVWSAQTCPYHFEMHYDFTFRQNVTYAPPLPDWRFPRLTCSCDGRFASWVLVDIDTLMVYAGSERALIARR
jgi:hypothetical protein